MADKNLSSSKRKRSASPHSKPSGKRKRSQSPEKATTKAKRRQKVKLSSSEIREFSREKLVARWKEQDEYIDYLLSVLDSSGADEVAKLKESESKLQQQVEEFTRRENVLKMRLATKQQELQELMSQVHELKQAQTTEGSQLHRMLVDPAVNLVFERMKRQLSDYKEKLEQAQSDLSAWKFTPDSVTGKKLMAKCRSLLQENQDLGKQISQGRVAQLEAELALQKKYNQEIAETQEELTEFVLQLDEEVEGMQATVLHLDLRLKEAKNSVNSPLKEPNPSFPSSSTSSSTTTTTTVVIHSRLHTANP